MQSSQYQSLHKDKVEYEISGLSGIYTLLFRAYVGFAYRLNVFLHTPLLLIFRFYVVYLYCSRVFFFMELSERIVFCFYMIMVTFFHYTKKAGILTDPGHIWGE